MPTAEQAKAQWCPMVRVSNVGQVYNRVDPVYLGYKAGPDRDYFERQQKNCNCIADGCAMWRWDDGITRQLDAANRTGFCGLAGKMGWAS